MNRIFALKSLRNYIFCSMSFLQKPKRMLRRYSMYTSSKDGRNPLIQLDCKSISEKRKTLIEKSRKTASVIVDLNIVICNFADKYLKNFDSAQLNIFDMFVNKAITEESEVFDWLTGVKDTPPKYQIPLMELLKHHAKEYNIKPLKTRLFDRLESLKFLKCTSDDEKNVANLKVDFAFKTLYEAGLKHTKFTAEEQKRLGNLLVDAFGPFKIDIESTNVLGNKSDAMMKRAVLQFMMEDYGQFPARNSILIDELERLKVKDSIEILDEVFIEICDYGEDYFTFSLGLSNFRAIDIRIKDPLAE